MRRCLLVLWLSLAPVPALAAVGAPAPPALRYAAVLRVFAPQLEPERALRLSRRTITQATAYGLDARLVVALVAVESSWQPRAVSAAGARGLGQLMPATARALGVDPGDPEANLDGTVRHLRGLLDRYATYPLQLRYERALASYNAGTGAVDRFGGIPPYAETQAYVRRVIALWRRLAGV